MEKRPAVNGLVETNAARLLPPLPAGSNSGHKSFSRELTVVLFIIVG
jgi:hypothetical protein